MTNTLQRFQNLTNPEKRRAIQEAPAKHIVFLCEGLLNVLNGNVKYFTEKELRHLNSNLDP